MTDIPNRRQSDRALDEKISELKKHISDEMCDHVDEYHAFKKEALKVMVEEHRELVSRLPETERLTERIIDVLEGEYGEPNLHGELGPRDGGLVGKIDMIERDVSALKFDANGGRGFSVRFRDKAIIAGLTMFAIVAAKVIELLFGG